MFYFPGTHSTLNDSSNTDLFAREFKSEKGMSSTGTLPTRASLATESAAEFPLMSIWPETQIKTVSLPSLVNSVYNSRICTKSKIGDHILA